jgi:hypothetical protein
LGLLVGNSLSIGNIENFSLCFERIGFDSYIGEKIGRGSLAEEWTLIIDTLTHINSCYLSSRIELKGVRYIGRKRTVPHSVNRG